MLNIEGFLPGIQSEGLNTAKAVDFSSSPSVKLPSSITGGAAGVTGDVQFNDSGSFAGDGGLAYDNSNKWLIVDRIKMNDGPNQTIFGSDSIIALGNGYALSASLDGITFINLDSSSLTQARTFTFPDANGVVALESGASGSFLSQDGKTVTVVNGIITSIA